MPPPCRARDYDSFMQRLIWIPLLRGSGSGRDGGTGTQSYRDSSSVAAASARRGGCFYSSTFEEMGSGFTCDGAVDADRPRERDQRHQELPPATPRADGGREEPLRAVRLAHHGGRSWSSTDLGRGEAGVGVRFASAVGQLKYRGKRTGSASTRAANGVAFSDNAPM